MSVILPTEKQEIEELQHCVEFLAQLQSGQLYFDFEDWNDTQYVYRKIYKHITDHYSFAATIKCTNLRMAINETYAKLLKRLLKFIK